MLRHDVTKDQIPAGRYDLIHARLVLEDFSNAFERGSGPVGDDDARYRKAHAAMNEFLAATPITDQIMRRRFQNVWRPWDWPTWAEKGGWSSAGADRRR